MLALQSLRYSACVCHHCTNSERDSIIEQGAELHSATVGSRGWALNKRQTRKRGAFTGEAGKNLASPSFSSVMVSKYLQEVKEYQL